MRRSRDIALAAIVGGLLLIGAPGTAAATGYIPSFFGDIPPGSVITNLGFTDMGQESYDGAAEQFNIMMNLTAVEFTNGGVPGSASITPGAAVMNLQAILSGSVWGTNPVEGDYAGGFSIVDVAGGNVPLLTATFTGSGTHLSLVNFGGGTLAGDYTSIEPVDNVFFDAVGSDGLLSLSLAGTPVFPSSALDGGGGLYTFTFTPTGTMFPDDPSPIPEPATGLLVAMGLIALVSRGKLRSRRP